MGKVSYFACEFWTILCQMAPALLFGVPLPLCSCGVLPVALSLKEQGAGKGAVVSFLISTPQTGVDSIFVTYGMLGWVFAVFRPVAAFVSGVLGGMVVDLACKEDKDEKEEKKQCHCCCKAEKEEKCCLHEKDDLSSVRDCDGTVLWIHP